MPKKDGKKQDPKGRLLRGVFPHSSGLLYVLTLNEAEYNHGVWRAEHDCQGLYISHQLVTRMSVNTKVLLKTKSFDPGVDQIHR